MTAPMPETSTAKSTQRMSNTQYHRWGKPKWWAKTPGTGNFLDLPYTRADEYLLALLSVPPGTVIEIGAGPRSSHGVRETITTT